MDKLELALYARSTLKNHTLTQIGFGKYCEIWQCTKDGSSCYGFDICVSRFGISVYGDIGSLSFRVGADYGIPFLAGRNIYYIRGKLEFEYYDQREVKPELVKDALAQEFFYVLEDIVCDPEDLNSDKNENDIGYKVKISESVKDLEGMVAFAQKVYDGEIEDISDSDTRKLTNLLEAYIDFDNENFDVSEERAYRIMRDNTDIDLYDGFHITEPAESIMMRIHFVNYAAKQIMKIKQGMNPEHRHMWE